VGVDVENTAPVSRTESSTSDNTSIAASCGRSVNSAGDHGQCGACTVLLDGRRDIICLAFAVAHDGAEITTAGGLAEGDALHDQCQPNSYFDQ
jgi:xanthine dehydrogenase YagT iron-sulfur-binding subunit